MDDKQKDRLRLYAWNYFSFHAEQRMKTFHFYLIIIIALTAGFVSAAVHLDATEFKWLTSIGLLIMFFSIVFGFIDKRNATMVKNGEEALKWLDERENLHTCNNDELPHIMSIFGRDDYINSIKPKTPFVAAHVSYSILLRFVFWTIGISGFISAFVCLIRGT